MRVSVEAPEGRSFTAVIKGGAEVDAWSVRLRAVLRDLCAADRTRCWGVAITVHADGADCDHG